MATIGLRDIHYAVITKDDETGTTYDTPKKLAPAMSLTKTPTYNRSNLRADDGVIATAGSKGPITVSVGISDMTPEARADILGQKVNEDGVVISNKDDQPKDVALMARAEKSNGAYRYIVLYKVQFNPPEEGFETKQETPTFNTPTLSGEAIPRLSDGNEEAYVDSDSEDVNQAVIDGWFDSVYEEESSTGGGVEG